MLDKCSSGSVYVDLKCLDCAGIQTCLASQEKARTDIV